MPGRWTKRSPSSGQIGSPGIQTIFDCNNASNEVEPHATLVDRYFDLIKHVHLTERSGPYPGTGSYDYKPVLNVLQRRGYSGWLSLEVFVQCGRRQDRAGFISVHTIGDRPASVIEGGPSCVFVCF